MTAAVLRCNGTEPAVSDAVSDISQTFFEQSRAIKTWSGPAVPLKGLNHVIEKYSNSIHKLNSVLEAQY